MQEESLSIADVAENYSTVLFVEKEGFDPLLKAARIAERFDTAIMSTKGMSTTSARLLLDKLSARGVQKILVLHDFDVSGFSIFGTLGTSNRRYRFNNKIPIADIGLRLDDVERMSLASEPVVVKGAWRERADTLRRHGGTEKEIEFLRDQRVELNAMTSPQIIDFIEAKFREHGVAKLIPDAGAIEEHARHLIKLKLTERLIADNRDAQPRYSSQKRE
jgi:DNA topoisomerase VI subunit A